MEIRQWPAEAGEVLNAFVRPVLAIMFGVTIVYMAVVGTVTSGEFLGIAALVIGFFFQARQSEKAQQRLERKEDQLVDLAKHVPIKE
jgi:uncharacterized membrane protein HdeD (DUF308 family)